MPTVYDIFDSNVWIHGITQSHQKAVDLINETKSGQRELVIDAYIFQEVFDAFDRSHQQQKGKLKTIFANVIQNCQYVHGPVHRKVSQMNVARYRGKTSIKLIAELTGVQTKDAPVLLLARKYEDADPTIHTHDRSFAQFSPSNHNMSWLSMNHIR
jgi:predicted nucleic acid-binding protein